MSDNERLMGLQERFLNGDSGAWSDLWVYSCKLARRMIKSEMKKKKLHYDEDLLYDLSINAVFYVLRRFKKKPSYRIKKNFPSAIYFGCIHSIFYVTKGELLIKDFIFKLNSDATYWNSFV